MIRIFLFLAVVPAIIVGVMVAAGQLQVSGSQLEIAPVNWPSSRPKYMQTTIPPQIDLSVNKSDSPDPATVGTNLAYLITVTNYGSLDATGVTLFDILPASVTFGSATPSQGNCAGTSIIICNLNTLTSSAIITVTVVVTPTEELRITNAAGVISDGVDPDMTNNTTTEDTQVGPSQTGVVSLIYLPIILK